MPSSWGWGSTSTRASGRAAGSAAGTGGLFCTGSASRVAKHSTYHECDGAHATEESVAAGLLRSRDDARPAPLATEGGTGFAAAAIGPRTMLVRPSQGTHRSRSRPLASRSALGAAACALTVVCVTCKLDKLTNTPPPTAALAIAPGRVLDTAAAGSVAMQHDSLTLSNTGSGPLAWSARAAANGAWLDVTPTSGTTPARLRLQLNPAGPAGRLTGDLVVAAARQAAGTPARFAVESAPQPPPPPPPPNQPPTASFSASCTGLSCSFTDASSDPDGRVAGWSWTFGDGGTATTQSPSHTYGTAGTYTVQLTVTDDKGATGATAKSVTVTAPPPPPPPPNQPPTVTVSGGTVAVGVLYGLQASFSDPDNDGPWTYTIDWGDGASGGGTASSPGSISATHTYLVPGSYRIAVTVTDSRGAAGSGAATLTVIL